MPLWEAREGEVELARARRELGSAAYAAQYQQDPAPPEGALIKAEWWSALPHAGRRPSTRQLQSWDMTFKDTKTSDFVVGQVWGRLEALTSTCSTRCAASGTFSARSTPCSP